MSGAGAGLPGLSPRVSDCAPSIDAERPISHSCEMGGRDRHPSGPDTPTLGARALMWVLEDLAASERLVDYEVRYKKNA